MLFSKLNLCSYLQTNNNRLSDVSINTNVLHKLDPQCGVNQQSLRAANNYLFGIHFPQELV